MNNAAEYALQPGAVLAGKYRVERVLGQGGMGVVAAVQHLQLEQRMALKLMLPHAMVNSEAVARFVREARAAARITSEHVARVFDVGALESGEPYIAMEYLEGQDVAQLLAARRCLPATEAIEYLLQACEALAEAHVAGIIHRDLKPGNLFLMQRIDGQRLIKVLDFGISKLTGSAFQSNAPATSTSALMGSPLYMSPEQMASSKAVDSRSDVWALGVVLYEMLCGKPPFNGETLPQVCGMVMTEEPASLRESAPDLPQALYAVVARCLEKQPAARFQSIAELAQALEPLASPRGRQSVERIMRVQGAAPSKLPALAAAGSMSVADQPAAAEQRGAETYAPWGETRPPAPTKRSAAPIALGLLAILMIGGGAAWLRVSPGAGAPAAPSTSGQSVAAAPSAGALLGAEPAPSAALAPPSADPVLEAPAPSALPVRQRAVQRPVARPQAEPPSPVLAKSVMPPPPSLPVAVPTPAPTSTRSRL